MPVLSVKFKDKVIKEHSIMIGQDCTIGRKTGNDIVIDNLAVSGFHAQIDSVATNFVLRDLSSTNGTFVNGKVVSMHNLEHNDSILIGKHEIHFDSSDLMRMKAEESSNFDASETMVLDTEAFRKMTFQEPKESEPAPEEKKSFWQKIFSKFFR